MDQRDQILDDLADPGYLGQAAHDQGDGPGRSDELVDRHRRLLEGDAQVPVQQLPEPVKVLPPDGLGQAVAHHDVVHGSGAQDPLGEGERAAGDGVHHAEDGDRRQEQGKEQR